MRQGPLTGLACRPSRLPCNGCTLQPGMFRPESVVDASSAPERVAWAPTGGQSMPKELRAAGVDWIRRYETPGMYFHVYRSPYWGADSGCVFKGGDFGDCFKFRGLVYARGHPTVDHNHDDFETRIDIGGGWYSYSILDT